MQDIYLALGSNLGDRLTNLKLAISELSRDVILENCSSVYETPPWGYLPQPPFLNQVLLGSTELDPIKLLKFVKSIEIKMGRTESFRNGPRLIDIDILIYGEQAINTEELVIPHPRMLERGFVLVPLAEIAPDLIVPGSSLTIKENLEKLDQEELRKIKALA